MQKPQGLEYTESKGDVSFYKNLQTGKLYQQLGSGPVFPVKDGKMTYKTVNQVKKTQNQVQ